MRSQNMEEVALYLQNLKFHKTFLFGLSEVDVWKKLEDLHNEYQSAFDAQEARCQALLEERDRLIGKLKRQLAEMERT